MTPEKLASAMDFYDLELRGGERPALISRFSREQYAQKQLDPFWVRCHLRWMIDEMKAFYLLDIEKAMRWLGYIQGELRGMGLYSTSELRDHSRTEKGADLAG